MDGEYWLIVNWAQPINHVIQWLRNHRHPPGIGMEELAFVGHEADMARKEHQIAAPQRFAAFDLRSQLGPLLIAIAGALDAGQLQCDLDEPRAIDTSGAATAP